MTGCRSQRTPEQQAAAKEAAKKAIVHGSFAASSNDTYK